MVPPRATIDKTIGRIIQTAVIPSASYLALLQLPAGRHPHCGCVPPRPSWIAPVCSGTCTRGTQRALARIVQPILPQEHAVLSTQKLSEEVSRGQASLAPGTRGDHEGCPGGASAVRVAGLLLHVNVPSPPPQHLPHRQPRMT